MRVILFNSSIVEAKKDVLEAGNLYPWIGIASITSHLLQNGISVSILDSDAYKLDIEQIRERARQKKPDIVGLPAFTEEVCGANEIAKAVKEVNSNIITVVGGPHPSAIPVQTLKEFSYFDVAGLRDSVNNDETGLLAEAGSIEDISDKIVMVLKDDTFRERLSKNALNYCRRFSWNESAEAFLKVMQRVS